MILVEKHKIKKDSKFYPVYLKACKIARQLKNICIKEERQRFFAYKEELEGYCQNTGLDRQNLTYEAPMDFVIKMPNGQSVYAGGSKEEYEARKSGKANYKDWRFIWSEVKVKWGIENGFIVFKQNKDGVWRAYNKQYEKSRQYRGTL